MNLLLSSRLNKARAIRVSFGHIQCWTAPPGVVQSMLLVQTSCPAWLLLLMHQLVCNPSSSGQRGLPSVNCDVAI